ncbi:hypothetical protein [Absidia glauca]|uniref:MULE transposase domain-containing protein n=1 Tax=Absidia glauca TaxID=4829 RepID=A0A163J2I9_ABSGL|nr:hypothetical protein [Absidia glauca]
MDCTYKTNKFGMPFLDVVGIGCFNKTFFVCGVFMKSETQDMYEFALDAIKQNIYQAFTPPTPLPAVLAMDRDLGLKNAAELVFESSQILICRWHINKNTLANCKKMFTEEIWDEFRTSWMNCMNSATEDQRTTNWNSIVMTYATTHPAAIAYLETWLPFKENFCSAWINDHLHLGSVNTSRVEGAHSKMKRRLKVSTLHPEQVVAKVRQMADLDNNEFESNLENDKTKAITEVEKRPIMRRLLRKISNYALEQALTQVKKMEDATVAQPLSACTSTYTTTTGIPCAHFIKSLHDGQSVLQPRHFHQQWQLFFSDEEDLVNELANDEYGLDYVLEMIRGRYNTANQYQQRELLSRVYSMP